MKKIELYNKRICNFYEENTNLDFETINLFVIDLLEKMMLETKTMPESVNSNILGYITQNMNDIKSSILSLSDNMSSINNENKSNILSKIVDIKKDYIDDLKKMIQMNTYENVGNLLEKNNNILLDKTIIILSDIIPKTHNLYNTQIQESLNLFYKSISDDTKLLLKSVDNNTVKEYINNFELKTNVMLQNIQQPIYSFISSMEDRINTNIHNLKDPNTQKTINDIGDFLYKFRIGDTNVNQSINNKQLSSVLTKMYNSAEISTNPSNMQMNNTGCILLKRLRKPNILICNQDSYDNISIDEVNSFILLTEEHNTNGIFISQHSGISTKKNYQIEINNNNNIIVFLHNVEYCSLKIESAVDIIDNLMLKFRQLKGGSNIDDISIPKEILDSINNEYQLFMTQKNAVIEVFKESQKKVLTQIDELRFPCLDKYLSTKYSTPVQKPGLKCEMCKSFTANNLKALAAHKRGCARKNIIINNISVQK